MALEYFNYIIIVKCIVDAMETKKKIVNRKITECTQFIILFSFLWCVCAMCVDCVHINNLFTSQPRTIGQTLKLTKQHTLGASLFILKCAPHTFSATAAAAYYML